LAELRFEDVLQIDLSDVTWIDTSGLAILVEVYHFAQMVGREVRLINVSHDVWKRICLVHLEGVFALRDDYENRTIH
jgi:anti-anti-sigma factor